MFKHKVKAKAGLKAIPKKLFANKKRGIASILVLAVLIAGIVVSVNLFKADTQAMAYQNTIVDKGDITTVISGTGTISPKDEYKVVPLVAGEILAAPFQEGDTIEEGDLLYKIDSSDTSNSIARAELSLEKTRLSASQNSDSISSLTVKTEVSGILQNFKVKVGDEVRSGDTIGQIINRDKMVLTVPYTSFSAKNLYVGQSADVFLEDYYQTISGKVTRITSGTRVTDDGAIVQDVEITVTNPGALTTTNTAKATIGSLESYGSGTFSYVANVDIVAAVSGEVIAVNYDSGDKVNQNAVLLKMKSDDVTMQLKNDSISVKDAQLNLKNAYEQLDNYNITSPISGTVLQKSAKAGDTIENKSTDSSALAVIADMSQLVFEISVDELDINKIKIGQEVEVTADSLPNENFKGTISKISMVGTTQNGVTVYPITIVMAPVDGLLPGMNVNASIVVEKRENALRIPIAALVSGSMVLVPDNSSANSTVNDKHDEEGPISGMKAPKGYHYVKVEIGISDENYVEILNGLSEGDTIAYANNTTGGIQSDIVVTDDGGTPPDGDAPEGGQSGGGM
ncbi:MAG: HlyD family efflux transporter periplasmic adaptor subunit [Clostridia bacterium]|nr:HlyD family efflux transporter periplasmic adaptor subunit [Clostridia bacterium]